MPATAIFLTQDEYDVIMSRLAALESASAVLIRSVTDLQTRVQSVESTLSAYMKRMADMTTTGTKTL